MPEKRNMLPTHTITQPVECRSIVKKNDYVAKTTPAQWKGSEDFVLFRKLLIPEFGSWLEDSDLQPQ